MRGWAMKIKPKKRGILIAIGAGALVLGGGLMYFSTVSNSGEADNSAVELPADVAETNTNKNAGAGDIPKCGAGDIELTPITDAESYGPADNPKLQLSIENTGEADCYLDLGTSQMVFEVQTGTETVWRSTDCQKQGDHRNVLLKPEKPLKTAALEWDRTFSDPETCDSSRQPVIAEGAAYHLWVQLGEIRSAASAQFLLQ